MTDDRDSAHWRLAALVGQWRTEGRTVDMPEPLLIDAVDTYEWLLAEVPSCISSTPGGEEQVKGAEIIGWDAARGVYLTQYFGTDGPNAYDASLAEEDGGLVWRMSSPTDRFTGSFSEDGNTITGHWERLDEEETWQPWMEITLTKNTN